MGFDDVRHYHKIIKALVETDRIMREIDGVVGGESLKMKNLLAGNGITIQFGGLDYTNSKIIKRARNNIHVKKFPSEVYPKESLWYLEEISKEIHNIINGKYDGCTYTNNMKESLAHFKKRYNLLKKSFKIDEISFEDFFLVHYLVCAKNKITNPELYTSTQGLKMMFLDSIYNSGKIQNLYTSYPAKFIKYLEQQDYIFTTNYDWNLENASHKKVHYLHGAFHIMDDIYNPESFRNQLDDNPYIKNDLKIPQQYMYLHSTALMAYSGSDKVFSINMPKDANLAIEKFANAYQENQDLHKEIETWKDNDNYLVRNLRNAMLLKIENPSLQFQQYDALNKMNEISGHLDILGLSPFNDNHIFEKVNDNKGISTVTYFYFNETEKDFVLRYLDKRNVLAKPVKKFWNEILE